MQKKERRLGNRRSMAILRSPGVLASALSGFARASGFLVTSGLTSLRALLSHLSSLGSVNIYKYRAECRPYNNGVVMG